MRLVAGKLSTLTMAEWTWQTIVTFVNHRRLFRTAVIIGYVNYVLNRFRMNSIIKKQLTRRNELAILQVPALRSNLYRTKEAHLALRLRTRIFGPSARRNSQLGCGKCLATEPYPRLSRQADSQAIRAAPTVEALDVLNGAQLHWSIYGPSPPVAECRQGR